MVDSDDDDVPIVSTFREEKVARSQTLKQAAVSINESNRVRKERRKQMHETKVEEDLDEFSLVNDFNPVEHADFEPSDVESSGIDGQSVEANEMQSDEGYNGSDEHAHLAPGKVIECDDEQPSSDSPVAVVEQSIQRRRKTRAGRRRRKKGRDGAFRVELIDRMSDQLTARRSADDFIQKSLFSPRPELDVRRVPNQHMRRMIEKMKVRRRLTTL